MFALQGVSIMNKFPVWILSLVWGVAISLIGSVVAQSAENSVEGVLKDLSGTVEAYRASDGEWKDAAKDSTYQERDALSTGEESWAQIEFLERHQVKMKENTELTIRQLYKRADTGEEATELDLSVGEILNRVNKLPTEGSIYTIHTPTATSSVRGTLWSIKVFMKEGKPVTEVKVLEGLVEVTDKVGKMLQISEGEESEISELGAPDAAEKMNYGSRRAIRRDAQSMPVEVESSDESESLDLEIEAESLETDVEDIIIDVEDAIEAPLEKDNDDDNDRDL